MFYILPLLDIWFIIPPNFNLNFIFIHSFISKLISTHHCCLICFCFVCLSHSRRRRHPLTRTWFLSGILSPMWRSAYLMQQRTAAIYISFKGPFLFYVYEGDLSHKPPKHDYLSASFSFSVDIFIFSELFFF